MADGFVTIKAGERRPIYGQATAASGTLTVQGQPTCTLYDAASVPVTGIIAVNVTGFDTGAQAAPRMWYALDTLTPTALAAGFYSLVFKATVAGSDGITRAYEPEVAVRVQAVP